MIMEVGRGGEKKMNGMIGMEELLKKMLPAGAPIPNEDQLDFSFAVEYQGPPVSYELPKIVPLDVNRIPIASPVTATSTSAANPVPVVQPIVPGFPLRTFPWKVPRSAKFSWDVNRKSFTDSKVKVVESERPSSPKSVIEPSIAECNVDDQKSSNDGLAKPSLSHSTNNSAEDWTSSPADWVLDDSVRGSPVLSSGQSSWRGEDPEQDQDRDVNDPTKPSCCDGTVEEQFQYRGIEAKLQSLRLRAASSSFSNEENMSNTTLTSKLKKGACHRCFKGNWLTEKESCIVCNVKYCSRCILRAMGSMPEGRKCVGCIGYPIDESKRESLGKCSRMLKRLLSSLEIREVMKAEKCCEANQLQADNVYVNGKQLAPQEMAILMGCQRPPSKMRPGRYWYDKVSGLWGKEGGKPHRVITPQLNIGGGLMPYASNGNTNVFINGREINKVELKMLQWAGVQCAGNPHFWVNADGSYQEEGQKNIRGHIWGKPGTRLICSLLSLPTPGRASNSAGDDVNGMQKRVMNDYFEQGLLQRLLLIGQPGSGVNTIFKQAKFLYSDVPFSEDERQSIKIVIQRNVYHYICLLLEARERFEDDCLTDKKNCKLNQEDPAELGTEVISEGNHKCVYAINAKIKGFSDWLLKILVSGDLEAIFPAASREYAPLVEELWREPAIRATYARRDELQSLPSVASYFLERVLDISRTDYEPSDTDILYAEGITPSDGLAFMEFSFPKSPNENRDDDDQTDLYKRFQLIRVLAKGVKENRKLFEMFEDVQVVVLCIAITDYDENCSEGESVGQNKMMLNKNLFEMVVAHPSFTDACFLLVLTKIDLLEQKICQVPLSKCKWFDDFKPLVPSHRNGNASNNSNANYNTSTAQQAFHFVAAKFKKLFSSLTGRKLYVMQTNGWDSCNVDQTLRYTRAIVRWEDQKLDMCCNDYTLYSTEMTSYSGEE